MNKIIPFFLILIFSCSTTRDHRTVDQALKLISLDGEGRGRIGYYEQNYLFRFESMLKKTNWTLSISIPMHGQEILEFEDLHLKKSKDKMQSLELQIDKEIKSQVNLHDLKDENIVKHLRSLVRFIESGRLGLKKVCKQDLCVLDQEEFILKKTDDGIVISKRVSGPYYVEFSALYFAESRYSRSNFYLKKDDFRESFFSLELFWRNK